MSGNGLIAVAAVFFIVFGSSQASSKDGPNDTPIWLMGKVALEQRKSELESRLALLRQQMKNDRSPDLESEKAKIEDELAQILHLISSSKQGGGMTGN